MLPHCCLCATSSYYPLPNTSCQGDISLSELTDFNFIGYQNLTKGSILFETVFIASSGFQVRENLLNKMCPSVGFEHASSFSGETTV